ncbi:MAG: hypothetical protein KBE91_06290 [Bacteroidia bacterium]|nr:hypothetical protein [Bacteroidia bacterium]MBP9689202.1 hypothetical protein [Bacteroidia bacterium]
MNGKLILFLSFFFFGNCSIQKDYENNYIERAVLLCNKNKLEKAYNIIISQLKQDSSYGVSKKLNAIYLNKNLEVLTSNNFFSDSIKHYIVSSYIKYYPYPKYDKIIQFVDLYLADQKPRYEYGWIKENKPELIEATRENLWHNDSLVLLKALAITANYTIDSFLSIGKFPSHAFYFVVIHGGVAVQKKYFSLFKQLQRYEFIGSYMLATMEDKMLMNDNKPQKYGTQLCNPYNTNYYYPHTFVSLDSVNYYRKLIGLPDVIDDWKSFGVNTDSIQKLKAPSE